MNKNSEMGLQATVFALVAAAFTTIYITQPVLPVLQAEFGVTEAKSSLTISIVILGISLANLPFGMIADRFPLRPVIGMGGLIIGLCGFFCAYTDRLTWLICARFVQGMFIPSLTTCLAAFLSRNLPNERLNVVMGAYVAATVAGGLGGRLLGGLIHPPLHWRYAFVTASCVLWTVTLIAFQYLNEPRPNHIREPDMDGFAGLLLRPPLIRMYGVAFGAFFVFSSVFNYLPFYLSSPRLNASTETITFLYLSYVVGIFIGPFSGRLSNRIGNGVSMSLGSIVFMISIGITLIPSIPIIAASLFGVCAGYFTIHSSASGLLNRSLRGSQGRANSLYVLFYYLGGYTGITISGHIYGRMGWLGVTVASEIMLLIPLIMGLVEIRKQKK